MLRLCLWALSLGVLAAEAAWFEADVTPQTLVSSRSLVATQKHGEAASPPEAASLGAASFDPNFWVETSSVLTYAHEAAILLFNQDYHYLSAQKMALGHYFHPGAFTPQFLQEQQALEQVIQKEQGSIQAYLLDGPQLDPTFKPEAGQWQVVFPMHQKVLKKKTVVLEQDLAVRMRIQMRQDRDLSSWQVVLLEVKPMEGPRD